MTRQNRSRLSVLTAILLTGGCAGPQTLHTLPRQALAVEQTCDGCSRLEFRGLNHPRMYDLNSGKTVDYEYATGPTYVDQRRLHIPIVASVTGLEQTDRFTSPVDGRAYRVHGRFRDGRLTIALSDAAGNPLGQIELTSNGEATYGEVTGGALRLTPRGQWEAESDPPSGATKTGWQHYPAGRLDTVTLADDSEVTIATGQEVRHAHNLDYWHGPLWVARLPSGLADTDRNRLFLFYTAVCFARAFNDTYERIDDCLAPPDAAPHDGCPAQLIVR